MFIRIRFQALALALALLFGAGVSRAATLSATLQQTLSSVSDTASVGIVIVTFNTTTGLSNSHIDLLRSLGIHKGLTLNNLGMVALPATAAQVRALASSSAVRSIWSNDRLQYFMDQARTLTGVDRLRAESRFTTANGGLPVSGRGDFSVVVNDSGIDATHNDLRFGSKVIQNVQLLTDTATLAGFTPLLAIENLPNTDSHVGHGTHCAGILGGTGQMSGGRYAGVAPGVKLIGVGSGYVLFILNALGGYEWSLANQFVYNIRIISNSWGSSGAFDPDDPINIATRAAYERNIISVFAAGNSGPGRDTLNPYAKAPWVIGVAAGTKEGGLAGFSSRGVPAEERLTNADPLDDFNAPTITAPGTGREFESNAGRFTAAIVSTRAITNLVANGLTDDAEIPLAFIPFYTQISGTSMATPFVAGVVALMLDADPALTPDEVKSIIIETASRMPGREDWEVGAGYINAYAAVDKVFNREKPYGQFFDHEFNVRFTVSGPPDEMIHIDYNPAALPGPGSANARTFTVQQGMSVLDVFATFDNALETGDGNTIGILLTAPDGATYSSGIAIPILNSPTRQVIVENPLAGEWQLEVRGVRGLAAAPNVSLPTSGAALPGPVDIAVKQKLFTLEPIPDIEGHPAQAQIESVLKNRMMDTFSNGLFRPDQLVTRRDFADLLYLNTALRQSLSDQPIFNDVSGNLRAIAEAVTAKGSTLRDFDFAPDGMMSASGSQFKPSSTIKRLDLAVALVRALGHDALARSRAGQLVTVDFNGQTVVLADNADIPLALRGYVQLALDRGILQAFFTVEQGPFDLLPIIKARVRPNDPATRAFMAYALDNFRRHFVAGT
ncbi:MAG TPA: S8 family serine peptidase [Blastocatellia bacterium]|nr:S8 family serine peptidase [Blastocatellia bacterium]